jgi:hypothetical protein
MQFRGARAIPGVFAVVFLSCVTAMAGKDFVMPTAQAARNYPAHDEHPTEKMVVAVDPYDMPIRLRSSIPITVAMATCRFSSSSPMTAINRWRSAE